MEGGGLVLRRLQLLAPLGTVAADRARAKRPGSIFFSGAASSGSVASVRRSIPAMRRCRLQRRRCYCAGAALSGGGATTRRPSPAMRRCRLSAAASLVRAANFLRCAGAASSRGSASSRRPMRRCRLDGDCGVSTLLLHFGADGGVFTLLLHFGAQILHAQVSP